MTIQPLLAISITDPEGTLATNPCAWSDYYRKRSEGDIRRASFLAQTCSSQYDERYGTALRVLVWVRTEVAPVALIFDLLLSR